jgi:hypothetical protein
MKTLLWIAICKNNERKFTLMKMYKASHLLSALILVYLVIFIANGWGQVARPSLVKNASQFVCLQKEIKLDDVVTYGSGMAKNVTVKDKLVEINARCRRNILIDGKGRQVYFYVLQGCWGNPPEDYQEILDKQAREIAKLRLKYRVVQMACDRNALL